MTKTVIIASKNDHKVAEYKQMLSDVDVDVKSLADFADVPEIDENGATFSENAHIKAAAIANHFQLPVIADDSGLMVRALNNEPGVHSARYAGDHDDAANRAKVLAKLTDKTDRSAVFHTTIVAQKPNGSVLETVGEVPGQIVKEPRGSEAFGYDCLFLPDGKDKTFGEMTKEEKDEDSHRGRALVKLLVQFNEWWHA